MSTHLEIAKERFLDLMASPGQKDPESVAIVAISQADKFTQVYAQYGQKHEPMMNGCPTCFGSGGKRNAPCKACGGTGRVQA